MKFIFVKNQSKRKLISYLIGINYTREYSILIEPSNFTLLNFFIHISLDVLIELMHAIEFSNELDLV